MSVGSENGSAGIFLKDGGGVLPEGFKEADEVREERPDLLKATCGVELYIYIYIYIHV